MNKMAIATTIEITSISRVTRKDNGTRYWVYNIISGDSGKKYALWATMSGHVCWCECKDHAFHPGRSCKHMNSVQEEIDMKKEQKAAVTSAEQQLADERNARIESVLLPECPICHKRYERADHGCAVPSAEKRAAFEAVRAEVRAIESLHAAQQLHDVDVIAPVVLGEFATDLAAHIEDGELAPWDDPAFKALSKREQAEKYRGWFPNDFSYDVA